MDPERCWRTNCAATSSACAQWPWRQLVCEVPIHVGEGGGRKRARGLDLVSRATWTPIYGRSPAAVAMVPLGTAATAL